MEQAAVTSSARLTIGYIALIVMVTVTQLLHYSAVFVWVLIVMFNADKD